MESMARLARPKVLGSFSHEFENLRILLKKFPKIWVFQGKLENFLSSLKNLPHEQNKADLSGRLKFVPILS